jgi:hypothetical protein
MDGKGSGKTVKTLLSLLNFNSFERTDESFKNSFNMYTNPETNHLQLYSFLSLKV